MSPYAMVAAKLSEVRHIIHIVSSVEFTGMYVKTKNKEEIDAILKACDQKAFDEWVLKNADLEYLSVRELRVRAHAKQIPYYSRMDKDTLIKEIKNADNQENSGTSGGHAANHAKSENR